MERELNIIMSAATAMHPAGSLDDFLRGEPLPGTRDENYEIADKILTYMVHFVWAEREMALDSGDRAPTVDVENAESTEGGDLSVPDRLEQSLILVAFMMLRNIRSVTAARWLNKMRAYGFDMEKIKSTLIELGTMNDHVMRILPPQVRGRAVVYTFCNAVDAITMCTYADKLWDIAPTRMLTFEEMEGVHVIVQDLARGLGRNQEQ